MTNWKKAQSWEKDWWNLCLNTFGEEEKQLLYASRMGLTRFHDGKSPYNFDLGGISVIDIGGGPCSLLLKCVNFREAAVIDPLPIPKWVIARYEAAGIACLPISGEGITGIAVDECWIYNTLQHVKIPQHVIIAAQKAAKLIRLFEWIDTPMNEGHPHSLSEGQLNEWLGGEGKVEQLTGQANCWGTCYYGIFPT